MRHRTLTSPMRRGLSAILSHRHSPALWSIPSRLLVLCALVFLFSFLASAQTATVVGTVSDPSGAVIPNASVTITNTDTAQVFKIKTGENGQFAASDLPIGHYTITVEAAGFKTSEHRDLVLQVADRVREDVKLEVGNTQESITVEANAIQVQSESGEVSNMITGQQMTQLATNGRSFYNLATIVPGASSNMSDFNVPTSAGGDSSVSFNGMRQNHNLWLIDGGEASDRGGAGGSDVMPSMDAIGEFRVLASNYGADYGLSSAGTMTMAVKSGTKTFHATAWEFDRNDALDAGNYFTNAAGQKPPELRYNVYGFNVGGPVFIPKVYNKDRNKTFFFYNMEWRKLVVGGNVNTTVPNTSEYGGQFSSTINVPGSNLVGGPFATGLSGAGVTQATPFPSNKIPTSLLNPNALALLQAGIFPAQNSGNQFVGGNKLPTDVREEIVRIDHQFSDKFWIYGHYITEAVSQTYGTSIWSGDNVPTVGSTFSNPAYHAVLHATYSISPTLLNEVAYNQNGNTINISPTGTFARPSSLNVPELFPGNNLNRIPEIQLGQLGTTYDAWSQPWHNKADDYQIRDDVSWTKGAHQIKMGFSWALYAKLQDLFGDTQGDFSFNGLYTGNDFADFLLGYANSYTELAVQDHGQWNNVSTAAWFQDNWRVTPRLTLNLGVRWDGIPHTYEANRRMSNFYPSLYNPADAAVFVPGSNGNAISPSSPGLGTSPNSILAGYQFYLNGIGIGGQNGIPAGLVKSYWANFGPRIGFAYDLTGSGKTVVRGGFGTMYERIQGNDMYNGGPNLPFSSSVTLNNVSLSNPNTSLLTGETITAPITLGSITGLSETDYKNPVSYQYSVGVEHQLIQGTVLTVAYVGNQNRHQNDYVNVNVPSSSLDRTTLSSLGGATAYNTVLPYLGFGQIALAQNAGNSHYNSIQISINSQIKRDLTLLAAYTGSSAYDPATSFGGDLATISNPYNRNYDYGPTVSNRSNVFVASFIYDLPFFRANQSKMVKSALGGWEVSGIITMENGLPLVVTLGGSNGSAGLSDATNRPNVNGSVSYPQTVAAWFSTSAFSAPALGAFGNETKGGIRGPGRDNWNISLFKSFLLSESHGSRFELRVESFNTFNHTQFNGISTSFSASNFGQVTSVWDPRVFQLGGKLIF